MRKPPRNIVVQCRLDCRTLAVLAQHYQTTQVPCESRSDLLRVTLEDMVKMLTSQGKAKPVEQTEEAIEILTTLGYFTSKGMVRTRAALASQIALETGKEVTESTAAQVAKRVLKEMEG